MRKIIRKKGIEPIVAAIMLVAITVISAIMVYLWISRLVVQQTGPSSNSVNSQIKVLTVNATSSEITIFVQAPSKPIVQSASVFYTNGTLVTAVTNINVKQLLNNVAPNIYKITISNINLKPGSYYCEIYTSNYGIIVTPSFVVS